MKSQRTSTTGEWSWWGYIMLFVCYCCCFHYGFILFPRKAPKGTDNCLIHNKISSLQNNKCHSWYSFLCTCLLQCFDNILYCVKEKCEKHTNQYDWVRNVGTSHWDNMNDTVWYSTDWLILSLFIWHAHLSCHKLTEAEQWPMSTAQTWDRKWFIIYTELA